ncbi:hypothetical protein P7C71_g851, partial [Lecanoromycetidae sp. Uapishka_2]
MSEYSPYADAESAAPDWKPGEEQTSTVFLALTLWLVLDVNIAVWRVFRKKQGLYYWALMSPRMAVLDRLDQLGFTLIEAIISGIYIWSLTTLLRVKSTIRQRRVMRDLFCFMIIVILMDIVVVILIFINQTNLSYSIQDFSYALKFKLEFVVLNQLMAVAAKGVKKESFAERRYNEPTESTPGQTSSDETSGIPMQPFSQGSQDSQSRQHSQGISAPPPSRAKQVKTPRDMYERRYTDEQPLNFDQDQLPEGGSFDTGKDSGSDDTGKASTEKKDGASYDIHLQPPSKSEKHRSLRHPFGQTAATATRHKSKSGRRGGNDDVDDEKEEIGLHMWENRGKLVLDVPWLQDDKGEKA